MRTCFLHSNRLLAVVLFVIYSLSTIPTFQFVMLIYIIKLLLNYNGMMKCCTFAKT